MASKGIVLTAEDRTIEAKARNLKLGVVVDPERPLAFGKTLFTEPGTGVPWDLLSAAWHFLERWDAAVPLWRYGVTAETLGTKAERQATQAVIRDLRVLVHSVELLFVRDNEDGRALVEAWREEMGEEGDHAGSPQPEKRLAFLRALYQVKPRCCVLPVTWLAEVRSRSEQDMRLSKALKAAGPLVTVEIGPGRFVRCHPGDEETVREHYARRGSGRRGGRG